MQSVRNMPVGWFGLAMGVAGLALVLRTGSRVLGIPSGLGEVAAFAAVLLETVLLGAYTLKYVHHADALRAEFSSPATLGFAGTFPVSLMLVAGCLAPWVEEIAAGIWWLGAGILVIYQVYALARWLAGEIDPAHVNAGWLIVVLGGLPAPLGGLPLGLLEASRILYGVSLVISPVIFALVFGRTIVGPPLPGAIRPSSFILLVPPSLAYALYPALSGETPYWAVACFYLSVVLVAALLFASRHMFSWPFGAPWAAFTFPLDAFAAAALRHASSNPSVPASLIAWLALGLAGFFVALVAGRALGALVAGTLCPVTPSRTE